MKADLDRQLRALVDAARPVGVEEAITRAQASPVPFEDVVPPRSHLRPRIATVAAAVVLAAGGVGWAVASGPSGGGGSQIGAPPGLPRGTVLSATEVRDVARTSAAAARSGGTAEITEWSEENGAPRGGYEAAVTFSGANIDEMVTSVSGPLGSATSVDDRYVDGQLYTYSVSTDGVAEWLRDDGLAAAKGSMAFPDPRVMYHAISPAARFRSDGTTTVDGVRLTRLTALDPVAIDASTIGSLADSGHVTSFTVWVDSKDVVQEVAFSTSAEIPFTAVSIHSGSFGRSATITNTSNVVVAFSELGMPQSVTVPNVGTGSSGAG